MFCLNRFPLIEGVAVYVADGFIQKMVRLRSP